MGRWQQHLKSRRQEPAEPKSCLRFASCQLSGRPRGAGSHTPRPPYPHSQQPQQLEKGLDLQMPVSPTSSVWALPSSNATLSSSPRQGVFQATLPLGCRQVLWDGS